MIECNVTFLISSWLVLGFIMDYFAMRATANHLETTVMTEVKAAPLWVHFVIILLPPSALLVLLD